MCGGVCGGGGGRRGVLGGGGEGCGGLGYLLDGLESATQLA